MEKQGKGKNKHHHKQGEHGEHREHVGGHAGHHEHMIKDPDCI